MLGNNSVVVLIDVLEYFLEGGLFLLCEQILDDEFVYRFLDGLLCSERFQILIAGFQLNGINRLLLIEFLEPPMAQALRCAEPLLLVHNQHILYEVNCIIGDVGPLR